MTGKIPPSGGPAPDQEADRRARSARWAGALFLAAFVLYGVGSLLARVGIERDAPARLAAGVALVAANSAAVVAIARLLAPLVGHGPQRRPARAYVATRWAEALLLAAGAATLVAVGRQHPVGALRLNDLAYLAAMVVLGVGSVPFLRTLGRRGLVPAWLSRSGQAGYALLVAGAVLQMAGVGAALALSAPGGLFELAFGLWLLTRSTRRPVGAPVTPGAPAAPAVPGRPATPVG